MGVRRWRSLGRPMVCAVAAGVAALVAAGCGGDGGGGGKGSTGQSAKLAEQANRGAGDCKAVKTGGTLRFGVDQDVISFDPANTQDNGSLWADMNVYDQLVELSPDAKKVVPGLAASWDVKDGGAVYVFHLRPEAKFSDGTPVTAEDVKFTFDRLASKKSIVNWTLEAVDHTDVVDEHTVEVTLHKPWAPFLNDLTLWGASILSKAQVQKYGAQYKSHPLGSGPFAVAEWKPGRYVQLKRNEHYWGKDKCGNAYPYLDSVRLDYIPNDNTRMTQLRGGQLDAVMDVPFNQIAALDADPKITAAATPQLGIVSSSLNTKLPQFKDPKVIQAINHAIDRDAIVKGVFYGNAKPATTPIDPGVYFHTDAYGYDHDLAKAKQLMQESTFPQGFDLTMSLPAGDSLGNAIAVILQDQLKAIGVRLKIAPIDATTLFEKRQKQDFEMSYSYGTSDNLDPNANMLFCCVSDGGAKSGYTGWVNKEADALFRRTQTEMDFEKRGELYDQWQKIVMEELPILWLVNPTNRFAFRDEVHDFFIQSTAHYPLWVAWKS